MKRSTDRILTTHVGSLVRPPEVLEDILLKVAGKTVDDAGFQAKVKAGVAAVVRKQAEIGVDIPSDGEFSKPTFPVMSPSGWPDWARRRRPRRAIPTPS